MLTIIAEYLSKTRFCDTPKSAKRKDTTYGLSTQIITCKMLMHYLPVFVVWWAVHYILILKTWTPDLYTLLRLAFYSPDKRTLRAGVRGVRLGLGSKSHNRSQSEARQIPAPRGAADDAPRCS